MNVVRVLLSVIGFFLLISLLWFGAFAGVMWLSDIFDWNGATILWTIVGIALLDHILGLFYEAFR